MKAKIYTLINANQEAHFPMGNETVAVCWNILLAHKSIKGADGLTYKAEVWEKTRAEPYIDFVTIRNPESNEAFKDEDSPVEGGLSVENAKTIAEELIRATQYIEELGKTKKGK